MHDSIYFHNFASKVLILEITDMPRHPKHDYRRPCTYHITLSKPADVPDYSLVTGCPESCWIHHYHIGLSIEQSLASIKVENPSLKIYRYVIMPDHVHILIRAIKYLDRPLGIYIGKIKVKALQNARSRGLVFDSLFKPDFHDRILRLDQSLDVVFQYIKNNPNRLLARRFYPDYFRRINDVFHYEGIRWQAYGNMHLLQNPFKEAVICHRKDAKNPEVENALRENWLHTASNGGVLVSPFIASKEKEIRRQAEEADGKVILLVNEPFGKIFKPWGHDFELCQKGCLLILAPDRLLPEGRETWVFLNRVADWISRWS